MMYCRKAYFVEKCQKKTQKKRPLAVYAADGGAFFKKMNFSKHGW